MKDKLTSFLFICLIFSCGKLELSRINKITTSNSLIQNQQVKLFGKVVDFENDFQEFGFQWGEDTIMVFTILMDSKIKIGEYESNISNYQVNKNYWFKAIIKNSSGEITSGKWKSFLINQNDVSIFIETNNLSFINQTSATIEGSISSFNGLLVSEYGHCWSQNPMPTTNDLKTSFGSSNQSINFTSNLNDLFSSNNYYVRSYAKIGENNIIYGNQISFTVSDLSVITNMHSINGSTVALSGTIQSLSVTPVIDHGHCWSTTTSNPNINNNKISLGSTAQIGNFFNNLNLQTGSSYYYRAYAITANNVKYGIIRKIVF